MSFKNLVIILICSVLIFATAPFAAAQDTTGERTSKQKESGHVKQTARISEEQVREVQTALRAKGFDPGPIDGVMGPKTMAAIRQFQSNRGLVVTGRTDERTMTALQIGGAERSTDLRSAEVRQQDNQIGQDIPAEQQTQQVPAEIGVGPTAYDVEDIRQVQMMLRNRGYDPGDTNGMLTSQTQAAIREFQTANNLPVTGKVDQRTQMALGVTVKGTQQNQPSTEQAQTTTSNQARMKPGSTETTETQQPSPTPRTQTNTPRTDRPVRGETAQGDKDASDRVREAATVLQELTRAEDKRIPTELLERAEAVAVIPNMVKGAFGIGGRYGKGVVSARLPNGRWSPPTFIQIGGGSFGAQVGVTSTDLVLVFTDAKALDQLEKGQDLKLGVDAAVVAGPIGRSTEAGVNANLESAIYAYSRAKGLFAGVALDGAVLDLDDSMNEKVYGKNVTAGNVMDGKVQSGTMSRAWMDTLERVMPKKRISQR